MASSINQANDSVQVISSNATGAQKQTEQTSVNVNHGEQVISDTANIITAISAQVNTSTEMIDELAVYSFEIGLSLMLYEKLLTRHVP